MPHWNFSKKCWRLAKKAFPETPVCVDIPVSLGFAGKCAVIDARNGAPLGSLSYEAKADRFVISAGSLSSAVGFERFQSMEVEAGGERAFPDNDLVRVKDPMSTEYNECGRVLDFKKVDGDRVYLVLVDGSEEPDWFPESALAPNRAGMANG